MLDRGFFLTWQAIRRQLAAMPHPVYLIRLIHHSTRRAFPGERLWTAAQLTSAATVRFLRLRNREGCDIYLYPYSEDCNGGYVLLDLDVASPAVLETMRQDGLEPCVVVQTSPGHLQAWLQLSHGPLQPAVATAVARQLARRYGGDLASADWRHLGRLAGFTNQKPARRTPNGYPPWVRILHARAGLSANGERWLQAVGTSSALAPRSAAPSVSDCLQVSEESLAPASVTPQQAIRIYHDCLRQWHILARFPQPDWSIVDLWVARALLAQGTHPAAVRTILQLGSPQFPRGHGNPQDYLRRTLRAAFSRHARARPVCIAPPRMPSCA
jgi:hypothetical protein